MKILILLLLLPFCGASQAFSSPEIEHFKKRAKAVTIHVDNWGIPHIYGKTDADAVFGLMYTQCQQNFARVERNYLEVFGRLAELEGEGQVMSDLQMQLIYDTTAAKADFARSPDWLKKLLYAFADGVNYYLALHPEVKPVVLKRFEPWFPLMYTDGSISATQMGGLKLEDTRSLYGKGSSSTSLIRQPDEPTGLKLSGSNGFAVAPSRTASGNAILYINPHVTFYFRTEVHMVSEEGLNVYGAATWGNFFVYQGFNEYCGWMHTSSYADVADLYRETIVKRGDSLFYQYNGTLRPVGTKQVVIPFRKGDGRGEASITGYFTHHGPVMGSRGGAWLSLKERNRSLDALMQSWLRTKAKNFAEFRKTMDLRSNNSNNTVYADAQKNIAYWHGNFVPVRDPKINWDNPVDGTTQATEWKGVHNVKDLIYLVNPASGWIQNCNSTPYTSSGKSSPKREDYPAYMSREGENARGVNAVRLLQESKGITLDKIIGIGYDRYLAAFDILLPPLLKGYDALAPTDSLKTILRHPVEMLRSWDRSSSAVSIATTLAVEWGERLRALAPVPRNDFEATNTIGTFEWLATNVSPQEQVSVLKGTIDDLTKGYGTWRIAWGDINRFQRNERSTNSGFDDKKWSIPSPLASAYWGALPSFNTRRTQGTQKRYGFSGNSFVAAVEFGPRLKAKTIMTGGESMDPGSPHFTDQAEGFLAGKFKEINFYREDVLSRSKRSFHPGEEKESY